MSTDHLISHDDIAEMVAVLQEEGADASRLYHAAKALEQEGSPEALEALASLVDSPNADNWDADLVGFAGTAMAALGQAGLDRALAALGDPRQPVRCEAAEALGKIGGSRAVEGLLAHLGDDREDPLVRRLCAEGLLRQGVPEAQHPIEACLAGNDRLREGIVAALAEHPAAWAAPPLLGVLRAGDVSYSGREQLADALAGADCSHLVDGLVEVLDHGAEDAAWVAATVLQRMAEPAALDGLLRAVRTRSRAVRDVSARAVEAVTARTGALLDAESEAVVDAVIADAPQEVVAALASSRDPNLDFPGGGTVLMWAAAHGQAGVAARLLALGADVDARNPAHGETALMLAARSGSSDVVRLLLEGGATVDARLDPPSSQTALLIACENGHAQVVELLLEHGADVDGRGSGTTPLIVAAACHRLDVIHALLAGGADPRRCNAEGGDALTFVFAPHTVGGFPVLPGEDETVPAVELLLEAGADPDNANAAGQTALMAAARLGHGTACRLLIEAGADPARVDRDGDDAAAWARLNQHDQLAAELSPEPHRARTAAEPPSTAAPTPATAAPTPAPTPAPTAALSPAPTAAEPQPHQTQPRWPRWHLHRSH